MTRIPNAALALSSFRTTGLSLMNVNICSLVVSTSITVWSCPSGSPHIRYNTRLKQPFWSDVESDSVTNSSGPVIDKAKVISQIELLLSNCRMFESKCAIRKTQISMIIYQV